MNPESKWGEIIAGFFAGLIVLAALISFGSCVIAESGKNTAEFQIIASGPLTIEIDCFGDVVDYKVENISLKGKTFGGRDLLYKYPLNLGSYIALDRLEEGIIYRLYRAESSCLWWSFNTYLIGCGE